MSLAEILGVRPPVAPQFEPNGVGEAVESPP